MKNRKWMQKLNRFAMSSVAAFALMVVGWNRQIVPVTGISDRMNCRRERRSFGDFRTVSEWFSRRLAEQGIIKEEEREIYRYGLSNGMVILLNLFTTLLIGIFQDICCQPPCLRCSLCCFEATAAAIIRTAGCSVTWYPVQSC